MISCSVLTALEVTTIVAILMENQEYGATPPILTRDGNYAMSDNVLIVIKIVLESQGMMISCSVLMERLVLCGMGVLPEAVSVSSVPEDTILATNSKLMGKYFTVIPPVKNMGGNKIAPVLLVPVAMLHLLQQLFRQQHLHLQAMLHLLQQLHRQQQNVG